ncbi:MAG: IS110 family transposase [Steroidobacteraceae bacterium]
MHATAKSAAATTAAIDLAKEVFELAFADADARIIERRRLNRTAFAKAFDNRAPLHVVMEACGSAHYWARRFKRSGHSVELLPAHDVRPYVRRNKTDRTDAAGLLEAARCAAIRAVPVKTPEQQGIQGLHRVREFYKAQRTAAINLVRGLLREFGVMIPLGSAKVRPAVLAALEDADNELPMALRDTLNAVLDTIQETETQMLAIEKRLQAFAERDLRSQRLQHAGGIGLITATALSASVGAFDRFPSGRHFASSLGLTPREHSSGTTRRLGRVSKRGDVYLRMLLIHGARAVLRSAKVADKKGQPLDRTRAWALALSERVGHNKAAVALANKQARRLWAAEHHSTRFDPDHVSVRSTPIH